MYLTLMRHGIAETHAESDSERPLTSQGALQVRMIARGLATGGWRPGAILCSPLRRSRETAVLFEEVFPGTDLITLEEVLEADRALLPLLERLDLPDPLVVGHIPGINQLAADLMNSPVAPPFAPATVACFKLSTVGARLLYLLPPQLGARLMA